MSTDRDRQLTDLRSHTEAALRRITDLQLHLRAIGHIPATPLSNIRDADLGLMAAASALRHLVLQIAHWQQHESAEAARIAAIRAINPDVPRQP